MNLKLDMSTERVQAAELDIEAWEERAAIIEFMGGEARAIAERRATELMEGKNGKKPQDTTRTNPDIIGFPRWHEFSARQRDYSAERAGY